MPFCAETNLLGLCIMFQLVEMNGKIIGRKPLYVAVAQRKDERKAWLQVMCCFVIYVYI